MLTKHPHLVRIALFVVSAISIFALVFAITIHQSQAASPRKEAHAPITLGPAHPDRTRHHLKAPLGPTTSNMTYHGGPTMHTSVEYAIFWEPPTLQNGSAATVSATYNSLITRYFQDVGGNRLYNINTQYSDSTSGHILNNSTLGGTWVDTSAYPASGCTDSNTPGDCLTQGQIANEVANAISTNGWTPNLNSEFFVFTAKGEGSCLGSDCAFAGGYCAYHSYYTSGSQTVLYANMTYDGTDLGACGASASPNGDADADSTINSISHEQMESVTDPLLNAWFGPGGLSDEIGDKCNFNFGSLGFDSGNANQHWNGHYYIVQQEWDNSITGCSEGRDRSSVSVGVSASSNPGIINVADTLTATISPSISDGPVPTGTVTFMDGATNLGTATVDGSGQASVSATFTSTGSHPISAQYSGDGSYLSGTGNLSLPVNINTVTVTVTATSNPGYINVPETLTAAISPVVSGGPTPTGTVTFKDGATILGSAPVNGIGFANLPFTFTSTGSHPITAEYSGDGSYAGATGSLALMINLNSAKLTVGASPKPGWVGKRELLTAKLTTLTGGPIPTGSVTFRDDGAFLGTVHLTSGQASLYNTFLTAGHHTITVQYAGDGNYTSSSGSLDLVINF